MPPVLHESHHALYLAYMYGRGTEVILRKGQGYIEQIVAARLTAWLGRNCDPRVPVQVMARTIAGTLFALITWWLDHQMPYTPQQMDAMFQQLVMPGIGASLEG